MAGSSLPMCLLFCLIPIVVFSENGWIPEELDDSINSFYGETRELKAIFETTVEVSAEATYPHLYGESRFIDYVNKNLEACAKTTFERFVAHEKASLEVHDNDFGGCFLEYQLFPVLCLPNLISIYGFEFQSRACPHGWTHYEGKNFWHKENKIVELDMRDLFLQESNWCDFLLRYCHEHFSSTRHGYYGTDDWFTPELEKEDLEIFVLTKRGLMIVFRSYRVGGWADGPDTITIPYEDLKEFIDPSGPLKEISSIASMLQL